MTYPQRNLLAAPVQQGAEDQHQRTVHHEATDVRSLPHKPGGGCADVRTHFGHQGATAHLQQAVPAAVQFCAHNRNTVQPREIRQRHITAGDRANNRAATVNQAVNQ